MPIFDAMDGPVHAPLRDPVRSRRRIGWALLLTSLAGLVVLLAASKEDEAVYALILGAVLTPVFWWLDGRDVRKGLAKVRPATAQATIGPTVAKRRLLTVPAFVAVVVILTLVAGWSGAPVGTLLAMGMAELITAGTLSRWERRNGKTLFVAGEDLFAR